MLSFLLYALRYNYCLPSHAPLGFAARLPLQLLLLLELVVLGPIELIVFSHKPLRSALWSSAQRRGLSWLLIVTLTVPSDLSRPRWKSCFRLCIESLSKCGWWWTVTPFGIVPLEPSSGLRFRFRSQELFDGRPWLLGCVVHVADQSALFVNKQWRKCLVTGCINAGGKCPGRSPQRGGGGFYFPRSRIGTE